MFGEKQTEFISVLIYGAGAVGLGVGSCLLKAGVRTSFLARRPTIAALNNTGFKRIGIFGSVSFAPDTFTAYDKPADLPAEAFDYVLVCTKSSDSQTVCDQLFSNQSTLRPDGKIILFQNGWGNAEIFLAKFSQEQIYNARVITGFIRSSLTQVEITVHADAIHIGSLFGRPTEPLAELCDNISAGGIPCKLTADIEKDLWAKMLYNCALNPLGAVLEVPYGELARHETTKTFMNHLIEEAFVVMQAAGFSTHWNTAKQFIRVFYKTLVPATADHRSSTLQDLKAGKKTEIEALTGQVLHLAEKYNIPTPYNTILYQLIQMIQSKGICRGPRD